MASDSLDADTADGNGCCEGRAIPTNTLGAVIAPFWAHYDPSLQPDPAVPPLIRYASINANGREMNNPCQPIPQKSFANLSELPMRDTTVVAFIVEFDNVAAASGTGSASWQLVLHSR
eukprot:SAG11_NODE_835_length_6927_cov_2.877142_7_plen_118_part_00